MANPQARAMQTCLLQKLLCLALSLALVLHLIQNHQLNDTSLCKRFTFFQELGIFGGPVVAVVKAPNVTQLVLTGLNGGNAEILSRWLATELITFPALLVLLALGTFWFVATPFRPHYGSVQIMCVIVPGPEIW